VALVDAAPGGGAMAGQAGSAGVSSPRRAAWSTLR